MQVRFPPSCSSSVELPFARIKVSVAFPRGFPRRIPTTLSHQAFPRGFPTVMSHVPPWCQSILGLKVEAVPGKQASVEWTETSGGSGKGGPHWSSSRLSCGVRPLLRCNGNAGNSFTTTQGKDASYRAMRRKWGSSGCGRTLVLPLEWKRVCRGTS